MSDAQQKSLWPELKPHLTKGKALYFSHGFSIVYKEQTGVIPPADIDVILVAPKGAGRTVRDNYLACSGINSSYAVFQDATGRAMERTLAVGVAIGSSYLFPTTFEQEVYSDLTGERGVLKDRLAAAYTKAGINKTVKELEEEAADIIRNNIPNYDYVGDFIKGLRRLPLGNFVSFPAEIIRTSTNIVRRALDEITMQVKNDKGELVKPLASIDYKRLIGMTTTAVAVPTAVVEGAKALYDVTEDEIEAMRRYVADWSRNSTLIPIRDKETGDLKYIDFSHANAYDVLYRPIQTVINAVASGRTDKGSRRRPRRRGRRLEHTYLA